MVPRTKHTTLKVDKNARKTQQVKQHIRSEGIGDISGRDNFFRLKKGLEGKRHILLRSIDAASHAEFSSICPPSIFPPSAVLS